MRIYLIRHVETEGNTQKKFNGVTESEYTEYGLYMKDLLEEEFLELSKTESFNKIYTSPILRAKKIAQGISEKTQTPFEEVKLLEEYNFGIFDGMFVSEAQEKYPDIFNSWINNHLYFKIPEGISYKEKFDLIKEWVDKTITNENQTILIVTHGATLRCLLTALLDLPLEAGWHFDIPLGGYCLIDYKYNYGTLKEFKKPDYKGFNENEFTKRFIK